MAYSVVVRGGAAHAIECIETHVEGPGMRNGALVGIDVFLVDDDKARAKLSAMLSAAYEAGRAAKAKEIREALAG